MSWFSDVTKFLAALAGFSIPKDEPAQPRPPLTAHDLGWDEEPETTPERVMPKGKA